MENEAYHFQSEQQLSQDQIVELLNRFSFEVKHIEELKKEVSAQKLIAASQEVKPVDITPEVVEGATAMDPVLTTSQQELKISKPPQIVYFS